MVDLSPDSEEHRIAIATDPHLRLMLTLVSFERTFDEMGTSPDFKTVCS
jgi:hypothetical protein